MLLLAQPITITNDLSLIAVVVVTTFIIITSSTSRLPAALSYVVVFGCCGRPSVFMFQIVHDAKQNKNTER